MFNKKKLELAKTKTLNMLGYGSNEVVVPLEGKVRSYDEYFDWLSRKPELEYSYIESKGMTYVTIKRK